MTPSPLDGGSGPRIVNNIWLMNADGSGVAPLTKMTTARSFGFTPAWSPDGKKIAYVSAGAFDGSDVDIGNANIWVMNADGSAAAPLTKLIAADNGATGPFWSPDGTHILYFSARALDGSDSLVPDYDRTKSTLNLWLMNADGSSHTHLTSFNTSGAGVFAGYASWFPDGTKVAFTSDGGLDGGDTLLPADASNVWVANVGTTPLTPLTQLTRMYAFAASPAWSPDGTEIAFMSSKAFDGTDSTNSGETTNLWRMSADGSNLLALTGLKALGLDNFANPPAWSRDGRELVYTTGRPLDGSDGMNLNNDSNLWIVPRDGQNAHPLTNLTTASVSSFSATWQP